MKKETKKAIDNRKTENKKTTKTASKAAAAKKTVKTVPAAKKSRSEKPAAEKKPAEKKAKAPEKVDEPIQAVSAADQDQAIPANTILRLPKDKEIKGAGKKYFDDYGVAVFMGMIRPALQLKKDCGLNDGDKFRIGKYEFEVAFNGRMAFCMTASDLDPEGAAFSEDEIPGVAAFDAIGIKNNMDAWYTKEIEGKAITLLKKCTVDFNIAMRYSTNVYAPVKADGSVDRNEVIRLGEEALGNAYFDATRIDDGEESVYTADGEII